VTTNWGADRHFVASTSIVQDNRVFWTSARKGADVLVSYELLRSYVDPVTCVIFGVLNAARVSLHRFLVWKEIVEYDITIECT